jgi:hypothetical protein
VGGQRQAFPFFSDGMVTFARALRNGQMAVFTDDLKNSRPQARLRPGMFEHTTTIVGNDLHDT